MSESMVTPIVRSDGTVECHVCGNVYERIGAHWSQSGCSYPPLPDRYHELLEGLMLGDGTLRRRSTSAMVQVYMINRDFLQWLDEQFEWFSTGVSLYRTANRSVELAQHETSVEKYHDVHQLRTRLHPSLTDYDSWYPDDDGKQYPPNVTPSPLSMAIWYVCDGSLVYDHRYPESRPYVTFGATNQMDSIESVMGMFERTVGVTPSIDETAVRLSVDQTDQLFDWMAGPFPGFEHKYERSGYDAYRERRVAQLGK